MRESNESAISCEHVCVLSLGSGGGVVKDNGGEITR